MDGLQEEMIEHLDEHDGIVDFLNSIFFIVPKFIFLFARLQLQVVLRLPFFRIMREDDFSQVDVCM